MTINREIMPHLISLASQFPAVAVMGPRQSGKTTLAKLAFPEHAYVNLEDLDKRSIAQEDPRGFLRSFDQSKGVIIDEIQQVPELFSYMQGIIDQEYRPGHFILTGSQHFLIYEKITQSLAGRIALLTLLPLSVSELAAANLLEAEYEPTLLKGFYPRLYSQPINSNVWYNNYISTYVERDVRQVLKISDILTFQRFIKLCAARVGNLINYTDLARDCDISPNTAKHWISILEMSFIIKLVPPFYKNFNKRLVKSPKLYFYDSSIICNLLGIKTPEELFHHPLRGAIFESFVMSELFKLSFNKNLRPALHFWRDTRGHEIDCIIEKNIDYLLPIEIKASKTMSQDFFKNLESWPVICEQKTSPPLCVVYGGSESTIIGNKIYVAWNNIAQMMAQFV